MVHEKTIIESKKCNFLLIFIIWMSITVLFSILVYNSMYSKHYERHINNWCGSKIFDISYCPYYTAEECARAHSSKEGQHITFIVISFLFFIIFFLSTFFSKIVVTDKRIYGKTYFGRNIEFPIDSISSVGTAKFKGILVTTASAKTSFVMLKNAKEIRNEISNLLIERQSKKSDSSIQPKETNLINKLKEYKELLDNGIITQEEFEKKKKEIIEL